MSFKSTCITREPQIKIVRHTDHTLLFCLFGGGGMGSLFNLEGEGRQRGWTSFLCVPSWIGFSEGGGGFFPSDPSPCPGTSQNRDTFPTDRQTNTTENITFLVLRSWSITTMKRSLVWTVKCQAWPRAQVNKYWMVPVLSCGIHLIRLKPCYSGWDYCLQKLELNVKRNTFCFKRIFQR